MGLPGPKPQHLAGLEPKLTLLTPATLVWRVYWAAGAYPRQWNELRHFGPVASRFDHHLEDAQGRPYKQSRGALYAAPDLLTCLAEAFQAGRSIDHVTHEPRAVAFHLAETVRLLDLTGRFVTQVGCHQGIHSSPFRRRTRAWSRVFYETWPEVQGLLYRSKMAVDLPAYVLFERAATAFPQAPFMDLPLTHGSLAPSIKSIARELGYSIT